MSEKTWPEFVASFVNNDLRGITRKTNRSDTFIPPKALSQLLLLEYEGFVSRKQTRGLIKAFCTQTFTADILEDITTILLLLEWKSTTKGETP